MRAHKKFSLLERWNRAQKDTSGFEQWGRNLLFGFLAAALLFFIRRAMRSNPEEAVNEFLTAVLTLIVVFLLVPVIEFAWRFIQAPRRILEDENSSLTEKNKEQVDLIVHLQARLTPKLTIKSCPITPTQTQGAGPCVYVQLLIECATDSAAQNCQGHLVRVRKWGDGKWEFTQFDERLQLGWSIEQSPAIVVHPKVGRRLNVFWILRMAARFAVCTPDYTEPMRAVDVFNSTDIFRFDVVLTADDSISQDVCLEAKWGQEWDKPLVAIVHDPTMPPIVCTPNSTTESA